MRPDDPRHGTYRGWQQHFREDGHSRGANACEPCHEAFRTYQRRAAKEKKLGYPPRRVSTTPVRRHLMRLRAQGMTVSAIVTKSGVSKDTIRVLFSDTPRQKMNRDIAEAILGLSPSPSPHGRVDSTGARRRIMALGRLGWGFPAIAAEAQRHGFPLTASGVQQVLSDSLWIKYRSAEAIRVAYDELSRRTPEPSRAVSGIRTAALRKGWPPALAWDDIDDPAEKPKGMPKPIRKGEATQEFIARRVSIIEDVIASGGNKFDAIRALGISLDALWTWCDNHNLNHLYAQLGSKDDNAA